MIPLSAGISGAVASTGRPARVADVRAEPGSFDLGPMIFSELCVPLKIGERLNGVVNAESAEAEVFTGADERLLTTHTVRRPGMEATQINFRNWPAIIPAGDLAHLFDRFFRGQTAFESGEAATGLGLAICKDIRGCMGGEFG